MQYENKDKYKAYINENNQTAKQHLKYIENKINDYIRDKRKRKTEITKRKNK